MANRFNEFGDAGERMSNFPTQREMSSLRHRKPQTTRCQRSSNWKRRQREWPNPGGNAQSPNLEVFWVNYSASQTDKMCNPNRKWVREGRKYLDNRAYNTVLETIGHCLRGQQRKKLVKIMLRSELLGFFNLCIFSTSWMWLGVRRIVRTTRRVHTNPGTEIYPCTDSVVSAAMICEYRHSK